MLYNKILKELLIYVKLKELFQKILLIFIFIVFIYNIFNILDIYNIDTVNQSVSKVNTIFNPKIQINDGEKEPIFITGSKCDIKKDDEFIFYDAEIFENNLYGKSNLVIYKQDNIILKNRPIIIFDNK